MDIKQAYRMNKSSLVAEINEKESQITQLKARVKEERERGDAYQKLKRKKANRCYELTSQLEQAQREKEELLVTLQKLKDWPPKDYDRRDEEGYPEEIMYDEFAYKRMVDWYRREIQALLSKYSEVKEHE